MSCSYFPGFLVAVIIFLVALQPAKLNSGNETEGGQDKSNNEQRFGLKPPTINTSKGVTARGRDRNWNSFPQKLARQDNVFKLGVSSHNNSVANITRERAKGTGQDATGFPNRNGVSSSVNSNKTGGGMVGKTNWIVTKMNGKFSTEPKGRNKLKTDPGNNGTRMAALNTSHGKLDADGKSVQKPRQNRTLSKDFNHKLGVKPASNSKADAGKAGGADGANETDGSSGWASGITPFFAAGPQHIVHVHVHDIDPCQNGGHLVEEPEGTSHCICPPQFKGRQCEEPAHCFSSPCKNGGTCTEIDGRFSGFTCKCTKHFVGSTCEEQDFCNPNPCSHNGVCAEKINGWQCVCKEGWKGDRCKVIDLCLPNPCQNGGSCTDQSGIPHCQCPPRYTGSRCAAMSVCFSSPCRNGGTCVENPSAPCRCTNGYIGKYCEVDVCRPNPCLYGGVCEPIPETDGNLDKWAFRCACPKFYRGKRCERPNFCATLPCLNGATCVDAFNHGEPGDEYDAWPLVSPHYFHCICPRGFTGKKCETDECTFCHEYATCINHRCVCKDKYIGNGLQCTEKENRCEPNPCQNNATCLAGPHDSYDCQCVKGYCGPHCETICHPCQVNPCPHGATCVEVGQSRVCHCPPGYTGPDCEEVLPNLCEPSPCKNHGTCEYLSDKHDYKCICVGHFEGKNCEECACPKATDAESMDAYCDAIGECRCPTLGDATATLTQHGCVVKENPVCSPNPCLHGGTCEVKSGMGYVCRCKPPYYGKNCECTKCTCDNPCINGGTCHDDFSGKTEAGYTCACPKGYSGKHCEGATVAKRHCVGNPCLNGGTCAEHVHGYDCICHARYTGPHCGVDKCDKCDPDADCVNGRCHCRDGFTGTGYVCRKVDDGQECGLCAVHHHCVQGACVCLPGYVC